MKQKHDTSTKPYYRCLSCTRFRSLCGGLPTRDMDLKTWCEYIRDVMDAFHLTIAFVAKEADVSDSTIERIRAVNTEKDFMRATARRIEMVVLGMVTRHVCDLDFDTSAVTSKMAALQEEVDALKAEVAYWRKENDRKAKIIDKYLDG